MPRTKKTNIFNAPKKSSSKFSNTFNMKISPTATFQNGGDASGMEKFSFTHSPLLKRGKSTKNNMAEAKRTSVVKPRTPIWHRANRKIVGENVKKRQRQESPRENGGSDDIDVFNFTTTPAKSVRESPRRKILADFSDENTPSVRSSSLQLLRRKVPSREMPKKSTMFEDGEKENGLKTYGRKRKIVGDDDVVPAKTANRRQPVSPVFEFPVNKSRVEESFPADINENNFPQSPPVLPTKTAKKLRVDDVDSFPAKRKEKSNFPPSPVFPAKTSAKRLRLEESLPSKSKQKSNLPPSPVFPAKNLRIDDVVESETEQNSNSSVFPAEIVNPSKIALLSTTAAAATDVESCSLEESLNFNQSRPAAALSSKENFSTTRDENTSTRDVTTNVDVGGKKAVDESFVKKPPVLANVVVDVSAPPSPDSINEFSCSSVCTPNFNNDVTNLLNSFSRKYENIFKRKRQQLEITAEESLKKEEKQIDIILTRQAEERKKFKMDYKNSILEKVVVCLNSTEIDENEDKEIFDKVRKYSDLSRSRREKLVENFAVTKKAFVDYSAGIEKLEQKHKQELQDFQAGLRKTMQKMQDDILDRNRRFELTLMRNSIRNSFNSSNSSSSGCSKNK